MGEKLREGHEKIKEFVVDELSDYCYFQFKEIEFEEEYAGEEYYEVTIQHQNPEKKERHLRFKYDVEDKKMSVELGEDSYEEVRSYDWKIKNFWIALLWE